MEYHTLKFETPKPEYMIRSIRSSITNIPRYVPSSITKRLKGTIIHDLYDMYAEMPKKLKLVDVKLPGGTSEKMYFVAPSYQLNELKEQGYYEKILTEELFNHFTSDSIFYDIGSYFGYYSQLASICGVPDKNIHAFEANVDRYEFLKEVHAKDKVQTVNKFVSDKSDNNQISLDDYTSQNPNPSVMKIDVEGAEFDVLQGMSNIMSSAPPIMYIEMHPQVYSEFDTSVEDVINILHNNKYNIWTVNHRDNSNWERASLQNLSEYNPDTEDTNTPENTYLIKAEPE